MSEDPTSFSMIVAKFDDALGPICLNAQKGKDCDFLGKPCDSFTNKIIIDALGINKQRFSFEENQDIIQGISIQIDNPNVRSLKDQYAILIRMKKDLGYLKTEIMDQVQSHFINLFKDKISADIPDIIEFTDHWINRLKQTDCVSDVLEKEKEIINIKKVLEETQQMFKQTGEQFLFRFFGEILAKMTHKDIDPSRGLIYLAFKDAVGIGNFRPKLDFHGIKGIFQNQLKNRLISLKIQNSDEIVSGMISELREHQSLLMMMNI